MNLVFGHSRDRSHDLLDRTGVEVHSANHHHVIDPAQNPALKGKIAIWFYKITGSVAQQRRTVTTERRQDQFTHAVIIRVNKLAVIRVMPY